MLPLKCAALLDHYNERSLREVVGLSRKQAKAVIAGNYGALVRDGQDTKKIDRFITAIESLTTSIQEGE